MNRGILVINDYLSTNKEKMIAVITHENLMHLIVRYYDNSFRVIQWRTLTNTDVFKLTFFESSVSLERIWNV